MNFAFLRYLRNLKGFALGWQKSKGRTLKIKLWIWSESNSYRVA